MLRIIISVIVILSAFILILAATKPGTFRVQRSIIIKASPEKIFPLINDFHNWKLWSPYESMDPNMTRTFGVLANGKGASYEWEGNVKAGKGRMEIIEESAPNKIVIRLDFIKPMKAFSTAEFTLAAAGGSTEVTWAMYGSNSYTAKIFHLFMNMDRMLGRDFDSGLVKLKDVAEK